MAVVWAGLWLRHRGEEPTRSLVAREGLFSLVAPLLLPFILGMEAPARCVQPAAAPPALLRHCLAEKRGRPARWWEGWKYNR